MAQEMAAFLALWLIHFVNATAITADRNNQPESTKPHGAVTEVATNISLTHVEPFGITQKGPPPMTYQPAVTRLWLGSLLLLALVAMLAALLPARRAARTEIVDALGHV